MGLYRQGFQTAAAKDPPDSDQAYYHGINIAYLELAYGGDYHAAQEMASQVLIHCQAAGHPAYTRWRLATHGDALTVLGRPEEALAKHAEAAAEALQPWQALSILEQSVRLADLCGWPEKDLERLAALYGKG